MSDKPEKNFQPLNVSLIAVSDRRTLETDDGGIWLQQAVTDAGHVCVSRDLLRPNLHTLRALVAGQIADTTTQVVIICGGTGLGTSDITHASINVLFDTPVDGFSAVFHQHSFQDVGSSTLQSRAFAGLSNRVFIACIPSSKGAIQLAWEQIIAPQLDARTRPCNLVSSLKELG